MPSAAPVTLSPENATPSPPPPPPLPLHYHHHPERIVSFRFDLIFFHITRGNTCCHHPTDPPSPYLPLSPLLPSFPPSPSLSPSPSLLSFPPPFSCSLYPPLLSICILFSLPLSLICPFISVFFSRIQCRSDFSLNIYTFTYSFFFSLFLFIFFFLTFRV